MLRGELMTKLKGEKDPGGQCSGGTGNHGIQGGGNARWEKVPGGRRFQVGESV